MGYPGDAPSATQHSFMDEIRNNAIKIANRDNLAGRSNWNTGSTQAANWVAMKARAEGTPIADAAKDFSDMLPSRTALFSRESVPGVKSGHRPDLLTADDATKASYHDAQNEILQDDLGRDKTLSGLGMLTGKTTNTPGYWQGVSNPSTQAPFLVGLSKGGAGFDEGTQKLTNAAAGWHALMTGQDATAAHFVNPSSMKDATAATMDLGRVLTTPEMRKIGGLLGQDISPVATPSGVNMLAGDTAQNFGPSMKSFAKEVQGITGVKPATNFGTYGSTSAYVAPDWNGAGPSPATTSILPHLTSTPKIASAIDQQAYREMAGRLADLDAVSGGPLNEKLQTLRRAFSEGGLAKVKDLAAKGLLPSAFAAYLGMPHPDDDAPEQ
jgi:hypothetical protein